MLRALGKALSNISVKLAVLYLLTPVILPIAAYVYLNGFPGFSELRHALLADPHSVEELVSLLRENPVHLENLFQGPIRIVDADVYYRNHVINMYYKIDVEGSLIPVDDFFLYSRFSSGEVIAREERAQRERMHQELECRLCRYLRIVKGVNRLEMTVVKPDMSESVSFSIRKDECRDEGLL